MRLWASEGAFNFGVEWHKAAAITGSIQAISNAPKGFESDDFGLILSSIISKHVS